MVGKKALGGGLQNSGLYAVEERSKRIHEDNNKAKTFAKSLSESSAVDIDMMRKPLDF